MLPPLLKSRHGSQVIQAMKPNALPPLADRYCTAINGLLRKELHAYTTELKRSAMARMAVSPPEPDIVKGAKKVIPSILTFSIRLWVPDQECDKTN